MIIQGDCLDEMKKMEANSIDSCVTDPPAGIEFMGWHQLEMGLSLLALIWKKNTMRLPN